MRNDDMSHNQLFKTQQSPITTVSPEQCTDVEEDMEVVITVCCNCLNCYISDEGKGLFTICHNCNY